MSGDGSADSLQVNTPDLDTLGAMWRGRAERFSSRPGSVTQPPRSTSECASAAAVRAADAGIDRVASAVQARLRSSAAEVESAALAFRGGDVASGDALTAVRGKTLGG